KIHVKQPAGAESDDGGAGLIDLALLPDGRVRLEVGQVLLGPRGQVRRTDLLFAFDEPGQLAWIAPRDCPQRVDRREACDQLALVILGAAGIYRAIALSELERRRLPELERLGRLNVVVVVEKHRSGGAGTRGMAKHDRVTAVDARDFSLEA